MDLIGGMAVEIEVNIFEIYIGDKSTRLFETKSIWEKERFKITVKFLVVIDSLYNGAQFSLLPYHTLV